jgi:hypothetical protein
VSTVTESCVSSDNCTQRLHDLVSLLTACGVDGLCFNQYSPDCGICLTCDIEMIAYKLCDQAWQWDSSPIHWTLEVLLGGLIIHIWHAPKFKMHELNITVKWLAFLFHIWEVPSSDLSSETGCPHWGLFCGFLQSLQENDRVISQIRPLPLPLTSFPIHLTSYSLNCWQTINKYKIIVAWSSLSHP